MTFAPTNSIDTPLNIGVFDSGVGGLSVFRQLKSSLPEVSWSYCSDSKNFPYGTKADAQVVECCVAACTEFVRVASLDGLVIACGTASTVALPKLRELLSIPVIGVVPAIKPAAAISNTRSIGLLATHGTVRRPYIEKLIQDFAADCEVQRIGSSALVQIAEDKIRGIKIRLADIENELAPFFVPKKENRIDVIVLGCTHFPLLIEEFDQIVPYKMIWVDSAEAIVRRIFALFKDRLNVPAQSQDMNPSQNILSLSNHSKGFVTGDVSVFFPNELPSFVTSLGLCEWRSIDDLI
ncbi:MAG: glutamate racemase [Proteobacteria bacterium]|nr:glutamate racemase [Pseudomonadota bacterium]